MRIHLTNSLLNRRIKDIERKLGIGNRSPIIVLDYGEEDVERLAKEKGMTLEQYEKHLNDTGATRIRIRYG